MYGVFFTDENFAGAALRRYSRRKDFDVLEKAAPFFFVFASRRAAHALRRVSRLREGDSQFGRRMDPRIRMTDRTVAWKVDERVPNSGTPRAAFYRYRVGGDRSTCRQLSTIKSELVFRGGGKESYAASYRVLYAGDSFVSKRRSNGRER